MPEGAAGRERPVRKVRARTAPRPSAALPRAAGSSAPAAPHGAKRSASLSPKPFAGALRTNKGHVAPREETRLRSAQPWMAVFESPSSCTIVFARLPFPPTLTPKPAAPLCSPPILSLAVGQRSYKRVEISSVGNELRAPSQHVHARSAGATQRSPTAPLPAGAPSGAERRRAGPSGGGGGGGVPARCHRAGETPRTCPALPLAGAARRGRGGSRRLYITGRSAERPVKARGRRGAGVGVMPGLWERLAGGERGGLESSDCESLGSASGSEGGERGPESCGGAGPTGGRAASSERRALGARRRYAAVERHPEASR